MFNRVLVLGGAGFIGSHMVDLLLERGSQVRVYDSLEPQVHGPGGHPPAYLSREAEFVHGDILNRDALLRAIRGCDAIVHDAALVGVGQSQYEIYRYTHVNTAGTALLLQLLTTERNSVERVLIASSMSIYGEGMYRRPSDGAGVSPLPRPDAQLERRDFELHDDETGEELVPMPTPESKALHCTSIYALNKRDQEDYSLLAGRTHKLPVIACRYFNVYGPRQSLSNPYTGVAAIFSSRIKNNNRPLIYEDGRQSRDFIHVRDLVEAKLLLLEDAKANHEAFNICTGRPTSIIDVARLLARLYGREDLAPEATMSYRSGDIRHCIGDPGKLVSRGWRARVEFGAGMEDLVKWAEGEQSVDSVERAHRELVAKGLVKG